MGGHGNLEGNPRHNHAASAVSGAGKAEPSLPLWSTSNGFREDSSLRLNGRQRIEEPLKSATAANALRSWRRRPRQQAHRHLVGWFSRRSVDNSDLIVATDRTMGKTQRAVELDHTRGLDLGNGGLTGIRFSADADADAHIALRHIGVASAKSGGRQPASLRCAVDGPRTSASASRGVTNDHAVNAVRRAAPTMSSSSASVRFRRDLDHSGCRSRALPSGPGIHHPLQQIRRASFPAADLEYWAKEASRRSSSRPAQKF